AISGINTSIKGSLSTTSRTTIGTLSDNNVVGVVRHDIEAAGFVDSGVPFSAMFGESPAVGMDFLAIIATNNFFCQVQGTGNLNGKTVRGKLYGYRAVADANTFAALTQSELLSA
ncbi:unnamed protein product, partial [marine sediment metagenome]